jgi:hypothetical protein
MSHDQTPGRRQPPYAAQWPFFTAFCAVMAALVVAGARPGIAIQLFGAQLSAFGGMFIAGFCYRERLLQRDRQPRLRWFRRMLR